MKFYNWLIALASIATAAHADEIGCVNTAFKLLGPSHKVCVQAFDDPKISGVACHLSHAKTGGISGAIGIAEDPSRFSIACRQIGPIQLPANLDKPDSVFKESTSLFFKDTKVMRFYDRKRNTLVYVATSSKLIDGSPMNAISTVPVMPWGGR